MNAVSADKKTATMMVTVSMASLTAGSGQCGAPVWPDGGGQTREPVCHFGGNAQSGSRDAVRAAT
ncbi:MAG: hypothetical protein ACRC7D_12110 [Aeromonas popoffii]|uniref:hypothetical protein n=1 Tax=Aeromonas popoffii TaxID=70856 RepID=UPI003F357955